jgi:hypothetical protein
MASRVGIELTSSRCTLVEVEGGRRGRGSDLRIRAFRSISYSQGDPVGLVSALRQLRASKTFSDRARVAIWGLRSGHQLMSLPPASHDDLHDLAAREARKSMLFVAEGEVTSGIAVDAGGRNDMKRDVSFAAASVADTRARLQPLVSAGFQVDAVFTPPLALASLARLQTGAIDSADGYLSVNRDASCLAIVRNGLLVFSREFPIAEGPDRALFTARLASELKRSLLLFKQNSRLTVSRVFVCGDYQGLRSLTAPLMEASDTEIETLDSIDGLPAGASTDDGAAELRVPWAVAADEAAPVNLLPVEARARHRSRKFRGRLLRAVALVLVLLALMYAGARVWANSGEAHIAELRDRITRLEQESNAIDRSRLLRAQVRLRRQALDAFAVQGPRIAKILEALADSAPRDRQVVMNALDFEPAGGAWRMTLKGEATGPNPALAQAAFNQFLRQLSASPYVGQLVGSPGLKVFTQTPETKTETRTIVQQPAATAPAQNRVTWDAPAVASEMPRGYPYNANGGRQRDTTNDLIASRRLWDDPFQYQADRQHQSQTARRWPQVPATPAAAAPVTTRVETVKGIAVHRLEFTVVFEVPR